MESLRNDERGGIASIVAIGLLVLLLIGAGGFGYWAYTGRQSYKNDVDKIVSRAVDENTSKVKADEAVKYAEEAKNPLKTYSGPDTYGAINIVYPKTWSAYSSLNSGSAPVDFYAHPDVVPGLTAQSSSFALRVQVLSQKYAQATTTYQSLQKQGKLTSEPYALPKTPSNIGLKMTGQLSQTKQGIIVILPMRDKTLKVWTEDLTMANDFNNIILPNLSFTP